MADTPTCEEQQQKVLDKLDTLIKIMNELLKVVASRSIDTGGGSSSDGSSSGGGDLYYYSYDEYNFSLMAKASKAGYKFYKNFMSSSLPQGFESGEYEVDVYGNRIGSVELPLLALRSTGNLKDLLGL